MIVYGDRVEKGGVPALVAAVAGSLDVAAALPPGIARHAALVDAFILLGRIVQGVADADRERIGADGGSAAEAALMGELHGLATAILESWDATVRSERSSRSGENIVETRSRERTSAAASRLRTMLLHPSGLPEEIELRLPEGYAFYAVYPEAYAIAARRLELRGPARVIGVRSIGTSLAAIVAAALGAPPALTVRPVGHPFDRRIALTPAAEAASVDQAAHYVVVDEGPGLSGSSFAAVADYLEARGIAPDRIAFLPSHAGAPGARAGDRTRARWAAAQRPVISVDEVIPPERLATWLEPLVGPIDGPIVDVSGGGWRAFVYADEAQWPAINPAQERRKFLVEAGGARWLVRFAGLGGEGARKLERARILHTAGWVPEVRGAVHGWLVERWIDAAPLAPGTAAIVPIAAAYLGARARLLPPAGGGASIAELYAMAHHNIGLALGEAAARAFAAACPKLERLQRQVRPVATDSRCDPHEWLRLADGRVLKADALDHDAAHDLIGAQDLAWDVVGVAVEFDLDEAAAGRLADVTAAAACRPVLPDLRRFLTPCYIAFRLGAAQMAADSLGAWPAEQARNHAAAARYAGKLALLLSRARTSPSATARP